MYQVSDFEYDLPEELIAQYPLPERTASRLLCLDKETGHIVHRRFVDIAELLQPNDILVLNNTKVFPARFYGQKASGGKIECLFERVLPGQQVLAHVRASKAPKVGTHILLGETQVAATVIERQEDLFLLQFPSTVDLFVFAEKEGRLPLPGYIDRDAITSDYERYQTVFAKNVGAVAAPTAGLHFDTALLEKIRERGIDTVTLTLHVGAGTFQPVRVDKIEDHKMHREYIEVSSAVCERILTAKANGGRVIAVGTTVVRSLETAARTGQLQSFHGDTNIFIYPGFQFQCVDALITNFHLPKSTLLMLVSAFAGYDNMQQAYRAAVAERYRFFSYGDAMFIATSLEKVK